MEKNMRSHLARRPEVVYLLVAGYCLLSIILKILRPASIEIDESEQAFLSQYLMLGYGTQPPLYNWLQYGVVALFGISVTVLAVVKNALLFLFLLFYGFTARILTQSQAFAAVAMLTVLTLPPVFLLSQRDLSHTVAALFTVSLFLYGFFSVLKQPPRLIGYFLVGLAVGLGTIAKYNFVIVPVAAVLAILPERRFRERLFDWRVLAALVACLAVVAPHAYWVVNNLSDATGVTVAEMKEGADSALLPHSLEGLLSLAVATIKGFALTLFVFASVFYADLGKILSARNEWTGILGRMLVATFVIIALIVLAMGATHMRAKWLALFTALLPLYLACKVDAAGLDPARRLPALLSIAGVLSVGVILMLWARVIVGPMIGDYSFVHIPYSGFARAVSSGREAPPAAIVADDRVLAGNLRIQFPNTPIILPGFPQDVTAQLPSGSVLFVWSAEGEERNKIPQRLLNILAGNGAGGSAPESTIVSIPYNLGRAADKYTFGYAWAQQH
ncbi:ArnT family glycosyltransferase [Ensifer aridi]|uniref:ArnT family glycosyltransferase n=1 Tax=Ensifer aridi TaxID=1708715 RepID=UPI001FCD5368|nr:glycosyltransferase family 39 protein [Ensifer aridi]